MAWVVLDDPADHSHYVPAVVLCLEDGSAVVAEMNEFRFDYRWDVAGDRWVDVSRVTVTGEDDADTDQEAPDDGGPSVPG